MFSSADVQREFIKDSTSLFERLYVLGTENKRSEAKNIVDDHMTKYGNMYNMKKEKTIEDKVKDEASKINKLYVQLKESINYVSASKMNFVKLKNIKYDSLSSSAEAINSYKKAIGDNKAISRLFYYNIGKILQHIFKEYGRTKDGLKAILKEYNIKYTVEYAYFLIRFYKSCENYHMLRYTTLSIKVIRNNFTALENLMEQDKAAWDAPQSSSPITPMDTTK